MLILLEVFNCSFILALESLIYASQQVILQLGVPYLLVKFHFFVLFFCLCLFFAYLGKALHSFLYFHLCVDFSHQLVAHRPFYLWSLVLYNFFTQLLNTFLLAIADIVHLSLVDYFKKRVCFEDHILKVSVNVDWVICKINFDETCEVCQVVNSFHFEHSIVLQVKYLKYRHLEVKVSRTNQTHIPHCKSFHVKEIWESAHVSQVTLDKA